MSSARAFRTATHSTSAYSSTPAPASAIGSWESFRGTFSRCTQRSPVAHIRTMKAV